MTTVTSVQAFIKKNGGGFKLMISIILLVKAPVVPDSLQIKARWVKI